MIGTIVNAAAIIIGALLGMLLKKGIKQEIMDDILRAEGVALLVIALNGVITNMISIDENGKLTENGGIILLISLVVGVICGELLRIYDGINRFGEWIENKVGSDGFAGGFVSASIIFCVGSMAVMGSINDGLYGDSGVLLVKSLLDFITAMVLASTMGIGVAFACVPVFVYQGSISLFASSIKPFVEGYPEMMNQFSAVGYSIILCIAINFIFEEKIRTANLLPAMLVPVMYNMFIMVENMW